MMNNSDLNNKDLAKIPALFGGRPVRDTPLYYGRQCIEEDDIQAVINVLNGDLITCGPQIEMLERELCRTCNANYAVVVSSGTAALHLSAIAANIGPGDEVIVSPITFAASANCVLYCGGTPVFADINPETYNIDPRSIKDKISSRTKAIVAVDFTGQAVELDEILSICKNNNLVLIEDAAHSLGTTYNGRPVGGIADLTTFSFHPVKTITGGEGGAVLTNDKELYQRVLRLRTHGITRDVDQMVNKTDDPWYNEQVELGYNYRLTDFQAAMLRSQLRKLPRFSARRREIVKMYDDMFADIPEIIVQKEIPESETTRHLYIIQLDLDKLKCTRRQFFDALYAENVCPNVHYIPVYYHSYYQRCGYKRGICPNAEKLYERIMSIPLYPMMTDMDVKDCVLAVRKICEWYRK